MIKRKKWTDEELNILRKNKGDKTNLELARMIGCSKSQVIYRMKKHKITRKRRDLLKKLHYHANLKILVTIHKFLQRW